VEPEQRLDHLTDEELAGLCGKGNHEAFTILVDRYKHVVHWMVRRFVGGREDEDLTQDIFLRAYRALPGFRSDSTFKTWILKIARNRCLTELRRAGRRGEEISLDVEGEERIQRRSPPSGEDLEEMVASRDLSRRVRGLVDQLPLPHRTALTLFYVHRLRYEEIAEIMEIPLGTVKTHIHRARLRLRDLVLSSPELKRLANGSWR
jgi:RNA polymerase sigma-70 factor (ECF subfamily)